MIFLSLWMKIVITWYPFAKSNLKPTFISQPFKVGLVTVFSDFCVSQPIMSSFTFISYKDDLPTIIEEEYCNNLLFICLNRIFSPLVKLDV